MPLRRGTSVVRPVLSPTVGGPGAIAVPKGPAGRQRDAGGSGDIQQPVANDANLSEIAQPTHLSFGCKF